MPLRDRPTKASPLQPVIVADIEAGTNLDVTLAGTKPGIGIPVLLTDPNDYSRQAEFDPVFKIPIVIDVAHHEIHEGDSFFYSEIGTLNLAATRDILIVTPNTTKRTHFTFYVTTTAETMLEFFEAVTTSNDGTPVTSFNRERASSNVAGTLLYHTPTVTDTGTRLIVEQVGNATGGAAKVGGNSLERSEFVLKTNSKYMGRATSSANGNDVTIFLDWYEHTPE